VKCTNPLWMRKQGIRVPCGKCEGCHEARAAEWAARMHHEAFYWESSCFVTLTYDDDHVPPYGSLRKKDVQDFLKRYREFSGRKIKYVLSGEYGGRFGRPHYHCALYGVSWVEQAELKHCWPHGFVHTGGLTVASARYIAKYMRKGTKVSIAAGCESPFFLVSKGLGLEFVKRNGDQIKDQLELTVQGMKMGIPRYYVKKLEIPSEVLIEKGIAASKDTLERAIHSVGDDNDAVRDYVVQELKQKNRNEMEKKAIQKARLF